MGPSMRAGRSGRGCTGGHEMGGQTEERGQRTRSCAVCGAQGAVPVAIMVPADGVDGPLAVAYRGGAVTASKEEIA